MSEPKSPPTTTTPVPEKLLAEFGPATRADWRKLVETELKGAPFDKRMPTATYEGITLQPIYAREDVAQLAHVNSLPGFAPFARGATASGYLGQPWQVTQEIVAASPTSFNDAARDYLRRGLSGLNIVLDQATRDGHDPDSAEAGEVGTGGLSIATLEDLTQALDGVDLAKTPLFVRSGASALPFAALLGALLRKRLQAPAVLRGCIEMDPLGVLAHAGQLPQPLEGAYREMAALTRWAADQAPQLQTICVHSRAWHEAGGSAVEELAFTLATGVEYLRRMAEQGLEVNVVAPRLRFAITVGENFFMEIAKLRALRMLWANAVAAAGGSTDAQRLCLHVRTSTWNKTVNDPYNNLLRATVEAFAGVVGGCHSMQVGAFDEVVRQPDDFSQRIARNTQLVLQKECNLERLIDPAGGSWYVETLTADLAQRAWTLFQEVEKQGGMARSMAAGVPQQAVATTAAKRIKNIASRRDSIVGVNQYANAKEKPLERRATEAIDWHRRRAQQVAEHRTALDQSAATVVLGQLGKIVTFQGAALVGACVDAVAAGATLGEVTRAIRINDGAATKLMPVCITRAAVPFERLRAALDERAAQSGARPKVFLCNLGPLGQHKARADFARGFFATGGYDVVSPAGFPTPEAAVEGFLKSGARVAVICSTDDTYPLLVPPLVAGIRAAQPNAFIVLAGYLQDQIEAHKKTGVNDFIHVRADVVQVLQNLHQKLGVTE